jgi:hypothetical protein
MMRRIKSPSPISRARPLIVKIKIAKVHPVCNENGKRRSQYSSWVWFSSVKEAWLMRVWDVKKAIKAANKTDRMEPIRSSNPKFQVQIN